MMKFIAHFSLIGAWFELRSSKIFGLNEVKGTYILSPSHCPLIMFGCLFLYRMLANFMGWDKQDKEKHIEEEGLADYWDALKADRDKPPMMGRVLHYKENYGM